MKSQWLTGVPLLLLACGGSTDADPGKSFPPDAAPEATCPASHDLVDGRCRVREIYIPGGTFVMGRGYCPEANALASPPSFDCALADMPHEVSVPPFWVEATVRTFSNGDDFVAPDCPALTLDCAPPDAYQPSLALAKQGLDGEITPSTLEEACRNEGKHHLTETQWDFIATGAGTRTFPWGEEPPSCAHANIDWEICGVTGDGPIHPGVAPVAQYPPNPEGVYDLSGNTGELVAADADVYDETYTAVPTLVEVGGFVGWDYLLAVRGGASGDPSTEFRAAHRGTNFKAGEVGGFSDLFAYRCARPAE